MPGWAFARAANSAVGAKRRLSCAKVWIESAVFMGLDFARPILQLRFAPFRMTPQGQDDTSGFRVTPGGRMAPKGRSWHSARKTAKIDFMASASLDNLDKRKAYILAPVVYEYIETAEPVASQTLTQKYN